MEQMFYSGWFPFGNPVKAYRLVERNNWEPFPVILLAWRYSEWATDKRIERACEFMTDSGAVIGLDDQPVDFPASDEDWADKVRELL